MITCNRDPSSFPEATAPHLNKTYNWQKIIFVALIKFGRKRTSDLLVYCGQSKCVGSTMHWKVWSESPRDKKSIHSRSSGDNRQNNKKNHFPVKVAQGHPECSEYDRVNSHHFYHSHHHSHYDLLRSPKGIQSAPEMIESTVIFFYHSYNQFSPPLSLSLALLPVEITQRHP